MNARILIGAVLCVLLLRGAAALTTPAAAAQGACAAPRRVVALVSSDGVRPDVPAPRTAVEAGASVAEEVAGHGREDADRRLQLRAAPPGAVLLRQRPFMTTPEPEHRLIRAGLLAALLGTPPPVLA